MQAQEHGQHSKQYLGQEAQVNFLLATMQQLPHVQNFGFSFLQELPLQTIK
jgi:hypothetical protein